MRRRRKRKRKSCSIFILLLSWITTLESTLAIRCFQCSDFPREKFSQDEYLGRCPGQKMTHYPSRGLYNACLEVRLRHNWTVVAQNAAIHELNCDPGSRRALQKLSTDIFRQSVSVRSVGVCVKGRKGKNLFNGLFLRKRFFTQQSRSDRSIIARRCTEPRLMLVFLV